MSTVDDIAQERQRLGERLEKIDTERAKLAEQLAELEVAERVLSRFTKVRPQLPRRGRRSHTGEAVKAAGPRRARGAAQKAVKPSLGDATLQAIAAHGEGISAEEVRNYLAEHFGMQVRANHLGMALQRHRRSGRLEQRGSLWWTLQPASSGGTAS